MCKRQQQALCGIFQVVLSTTGMSCLKQALCRPLSPYLRTGQPAAQEQAAGALQGLSIGCHRNQSIIFEAAAGHLLDALFRSDRPAVRKQAIKALWSLLYPCRIDLLWEIIDVHKMMDAINLRLVVVLILLCTALIAEYLSRQISSCCLEGTMHSSICCGCHNTHKC